MKLILYPMIFYLGLADLMAGLVIFFRTGAKPRFRDRIRDAVSFLQED